MLREKSYQSRTYELLKEAFTNECFGELMAKQFAKIAESEGVSGVATELSELAYGDHSHALSYFNVLRDAGEKFLGFKTGHTSENIKTLLTWEVVKSDGCAALIKIARDEKLEEIAEMMEEISIAQMTHIHRLNRLVNENIQW